MLYVEKIEGRNSIVLSYDRRVQQCDRRIIDGLGLRYKRLSLYLEGESQNLRLINHHFTTLSLHFFGIAICIFHKTDI